MQGVLEVMLAWSGGILRWDGSVRVCVLYVGYKSLVVLGGFGVLGFGVVGR